MAAENSPAARASTMDKTLASGSEHTSPTPSTKEEAAFQHANPSEPQETAVQFDTSDYPTGLPLFLITSALVLVLFACNLETTIITTAIPRITDDFHSVDE